jgi:hypothetical protein
MKKFYKIKDRQDYQVSPGEYIILFVIIFTVTGLPFMNSTYNTSTRNINSVATVGYFNISLSSIGSTTNNGIVKNVFGKTINNVELIIDWRRITDNNLITVETRRSTRTDRE